MASKRPHPQGAEDHKPPQSQAKKAEARRKAAREDKPEAASSYEHRSAESVIEGGANEQRGEPPEGYGTEAPQVQGGGKR